MNIPVPKESKGQIDKAGEILKGPAHDRESGEWAQDLADRWRACHAYPINTFQATLRNNVAKLSDSNDCIVAQRLKRMPTIIDKLRHSPSMHLTTMQDICGVRAIFPSISDVYTIADIYRSKSRFKHELVKATDYIQNPRTLDGYRSLHLIYKYSNAQAPEYNGLRVELQLRTKLQHIWATAVETMSTCLGQALKSRRGEVDSDWIDFFAITSSAFAYMEDTSRIPRFHNLSAKDTSLAVATAEKKISALERMGSFSAAINEIVKGDNRKWSYHLLILNSLKKSVQVTAYDRDSGAKAMEDYSIAEARAVNGERIEPVLVSAGPLDKLRKAYPNFFLDISEFTAIVKKLIQS